MPGQCPSFHLYTDKCSPYQEIFPASCDCHLKPLLPLAGTSEGCLENTDTSVGLRTFSFGLVLLLFFFFTLIEKKI